MEKYYFYSIGNEQHGPCKIEELKTKGLTGETFIWTKGMDNWIKLKELKEVHDQILVQQIPPPLPIEINETIPKTDISGNLNAASKIQNETLQESKPYNKTLTKFLIWCGFHLFALVMSYSRVPIFNTSSSRVTESFWPFVKFVEKKNWGFPQDMLEGKSHEEIEAMFNEKTFNGLFYKYDWTEFAVYVGGALLLFIILRVSNEQKKNLT